MRIVLIEDNALLADGVSKVLVDEGHAVEYFNDGVAADDYLAREGCDLAIIDINIPSLSGLDVLRQMRSRSDMSPVLVLTARDTTEDRVAGLDAGADDYLVKPFAMEELEARVRALLRRSGGRFDEPRIRVGQLEFDRGARRAYIKDRELNLPRKELALLECLVCRPGRLVSKDEIANHIYGVGSDVEGHAIEIYISRLRKHLLESNAEIRTARGLGYMIEASC